MNSKQAEARANELAERLERRSAQLQRQKQLSPMPPRVIGGALVLPAGMLHGITATPNGQSSDAEAKRRTELAAMDAVMAIEYELGFKPRDVSAAKCGYDVESLVPDAEHHGDEPCLRMIEVKGRTAGADTVTISRNEVLCALNRPDTWMLAIVEVDGKTTHTKYLKNPEFRTPSFTENSTNFDIGRLTESAEVVLERTDTWL